MGWLLCLRAGAAAQYSAWLYVYWQIAAEIVPSARAQLDAALTDGPRQDIAAIVTRMQRGQLPLLRAAGWGVYDQYLRANRVEEGLRSYSAAITLILRARFADGWTPIRRE